MEYTIIYKKSLLEYNSKAIKDLYLSGTTRVKLMRGKWYDLYYSQAQRAYYAQVSQVQFNTGAK